MHTGIPEFTPEFRGTPRNSRIYPGIPGNPPGIPVHAHPPPEYWGKNRGVGRKRGTNPGFPGGSPEKTRVNPGFSTFYDMHAYACIYACIKILRKKLLDIAF